MSVNNVGGNHPNYSTYLAEKNKPIKEQNKAEETVKETQEEAADVKKNTDGDKYVPQKGANGSYKTDFNKVAAMQRQAANKMQAFEKMVSTLFQKQGIKYNQSKGIKDNLELLIASGGVSEQERLEAQQAISEDGEYGVNKTSERILDFAKALSGGDPSKIGLLKDAVIQGFKEAEKAWGGKLPEISQQTYDKIMEGFDEWEKSATGKTETKAE